MRAMPSVVFALLLGISLVCAVADAPSAAAVVRVPMLFTGAVATGAHPPPQCDLSDFARGERAARVDVAKMDADPKSVPAFRRRWPAGGSGGGNLALCGSGGGDLPFGPSNSC